MTTLYWDTPAPGPDRAILTARAMEAIQAEHLEEIAGRLLAAWDRVADDTRTDLDTRSAIEELRRQLPRCAAAHAARLAAEQDARRGDWSDPAPFYDYQPQYEEEVA